MCFATTFRAACLASCALVTAASLRPAAHADSIDFLAQWGGPMEAVSVVGTTACVGQGARVLVFDVTDPAAPTLMAESPPLPESVQAIRVSGSYAYVADFWAGGLVILDISSGGAPTIVGSLPWIGPAHDVVVSGPYAFVAVGDLGLAVVNVADPATPVLETTFDTPGYARRVALAGAYACVADGPGDLQIIDVNEPLTPSLAGSCALPGEAEGLSVLGTVAYVAASYDGGLCVVDVSDPAAPALVGSCATDAIALDVVVAGDYAHVANSWLGLALVDVSSPTAPAYVGQYDTPGWARHVALSGTNAYVADQGGGLQIVDVSAPPAAVLAGEYRRACGEATDVAANNGIVFLSHGGAGGGVLAFSVMNPTDPQLLSNAPTYEFAWGLTHADPYVYLADGCAGLGVIDATDPANLQRLGVAWSGCAAREVAVQSGFAYVADDHQGLLVFDIADPDAPQLRGSWRDVANPGYPLGVAVAGQYAYLASAEAGVEIIDVSDPNDPVGVARYDSPGFARDVAVAGSYALVADDWAGLMVLDVSTPAVPVWLGTCDQCGSAQGVTLIGSHALVAAHDRGVLLVDWSDPASPEVVSSYDTTGLARRVALCGNLVLAADMAGGLVVLALAIENDYAWSNPLGGGFAQPGNWTPEGPPGPADRATFNLPASYTVTFPDAYDVINGALRVNGGEVTFDLSGRTYTLDVNSEASQVIASDATATLHVQNGLLENRGQLFVAEHAGSSGQLVVESFGGATSELRSERQVIVGLDGGEGSVDVIGAGAELRVTGRHPSDPFDLISLELGRGGFGAMNILDGGHVYVPYGGAVQTGYVSVGGGFGDGVLTIDGAGSALDIDCMLEVGRDGYGSVWVQNGGQLRIIGIPPDGSYAFIGLRAPGEVHVSGTDSLFSLAGQLTVGQAHGGQLAVSDGGVVDLGVATFIVGDLDAPNVTGTVTVTGTESTLFAGLTRVGAEHPGSVEVTDGAFMETQRQIQLGYGDAGFLYIDSGARVVSHKSTSPTSSSGLLGMLTDGSGHAFVTGAGAQWTQDGVLTIGWNGVGELQIVEGGFVQSVGGVIGRLTGSNGAVTVADPNSTWEVLGDLTIGGLPDAAGGSAVLTVTSGAAVFVDAGVTVWSAGTVDLAGGLISLGPDALTLGGELRGSGTIWGTLDNTSGAIVPGAPLGRLELGGSYSQQEAGTLAIEIGGTAAGDSYDQLVVGGNADLAGVLHVELAGGFTPALGDRFEVVTASSVTGSFSEQALPSIPGMRIALIVSSDSVAVVATWPADADGDLDVDMADVIAFEACLTGPGVPPVSDCATFDADADGDVDMGDFQAVQSLFTGSMRDFSPDSWITRD